jgi:hypothetical protein
MSSQTTYQDELVNITADALILKKYYFPFLTPKIIPFSSITEIRAEKPRLSNGQWRIWGSGTLLTWYPFDGNRPSRDTIFFVSIAGKKVTAAFTAKDSKAVSAILIQRGLLRELPR